MPEESEDTGSPDEPSKVQASCLFVRHRNALAVRADVSPLFMDLYLHTMESGFEFAPGDDVLLKEGLAALTLHLASKPWRDNTAWTLSFKDINRNLFLTGNSLTESVVGRIFTENVKETDRSLFIAQVKDPDQEARQSMVHFEGQNLFEIVEAFYVQSEQRPARFFQLEPETWALLCAQPGCDMEWFSSVTSENMTRLEKEEETSLLETRYYRFHCGCTPERLYPSFLGASEDDLEHLFEGKPHISVECPRCAGRLTLNRQEIEDRRG